MFYSVCNSRRVEPHFLNASYRREGRLSRNDESQHSITLARSIPPVLLHTPSLASVNGAAKVYTLSPAAILVSQSSLGKVRGQYD